MRKEAMVTADPDTQAVVLSANQRSILESIVRRSLCPQAIATRAKVVLAAGEGLGSVWIARRVGCSRDLARRWRARYQAAQQAWGPGAAEWDLEALAGKIEETLADDYRSGAPGKFQPEQFCQIMALACKTPAACGRPVTHWTAKDLADEAVKRGSVDSISPRHVGRFLKGGGPAAAQDAVLAQQPRPAISRGVCGPGGSGVRRICLGHRVVPAGRAYGECG